MDDSRKGNDSFKRISKRRNGGFFYCGWMCRVITKWRSHMIKMYAVKQCLSAKKMEQWFACFLAMSADVQATTKNIMLVTKVEIMMEAGATIAQDLLARYNGFICIIEGSGTFCEKDKCFGRTGPMKMTGKKRSLTVMRKRNCERFYRRMSRSERKLWPIGQLWWIQKKKFAKLI